MALARSELRHLLISVSRYQRATRERLRGNGDVCGVVAASTRLAVGTVEASEGVVGSGVMLVHKAATAWRWIMRYPSCTCASKPISALPWGSLVAAADKGGVTARGYRYQRLGMGSGSVAASVGASADTARCCLDRSFSAATRCCRHTPASAWGLITTRRRGTWRAGDGAASVVVECGCTRCTPVDATVPCASASMRPPGRELLSGPVPGAGAVHSAFKVLLEADDAGSCLPTCGTAAQPRLWNFNTTSSLRRLRSCAGCGAGSRKSASDAVAANELNSAPHTSVPFDAARA